MKITVLLLLAACALRAADTSATRKKDLLWNKLAQNIETLDRQFNGAAGVAILDLTDGRSWTYHADEVFPTASTIKLTILADLYRQEDLARQGKPSVARLNTLYTVQKEDLVTDSAVLGNMTPGVTVLTNRDLAGAVVAVSDNSASNILAKRLGMGNVNAMLDELNLKQTRLQRMMMDLQAAREGRENVATPNELVRLLQAVYEKKVFGPELTDDFFRLLSTTKDSWMPRLLPESVKVANKPGALAGVRCDAGIIFVPNRPFALAVMTSYDENEHTAEEFISQVSLMAWKMFDVLAVSSDYGRQITERNSH
jgi:beta-lactamase class A